MDWNGQEVDDGNRPVRGVFRGRKERVGLHDGSAMIVFVGNIKCAVCREPD